MICRITKPVGFTKRTIPSASIHQSNRESQTIRYTECTIGLDAIKGNGTTIKRGVAGSSYDAYIRKRAAQALCADTTMYE